MSLHNRMQARPPDLTHALRPSGMRSDSKCVCPYHPYVPKLQLRTGPDLQQALHVRRQPCPAARVVPHRIQLDHLLGRRPCGVHSAHPLSGPSQHADLCMSMTCKTENDTMPWRL